MQLLTTEDLDLHIRCLCELLSSPESWWQGFLAPLSVYLCLLHGWLWKGLN